MPVPALCWCEDGRVLASAGADRRVLLWDASALAAAGMSDAHSVAQLSRLLAEAAPIQAPIQVNPLPPPPGLPLIASLHGHRAALRALSFCGPRQILASATADGDLKFWDTKRRTCVYTIDAPRAAMDGAAGKKTADASSAAPPPVLAAVLFSSSALDARSRLLSLPRGGTSPNAGADSAPDVLCVVAPRSQTPSDISASANAVVGVAVMPEMVLATGPFLTPNPGAVSVHMIAGIL
jgi:WD40 repeat protein